MKTLTINHSNGHISTYKLIEDGQDLPIAYHEGTPQGVIDALESARKAKQRVKIYLGDIVTGKNWNEEHHTTGTIGLSRGKDARYPLLIPNARSTGGGQILTHCIIKIKVGHYTVYKNPNFKQSKFEIKELPKNLRPGYTHSLLIDGEVYSNHKNERSAKLLLTKLS